MEYDLQIHTESVDCLRAELTHVIDYFLGLGHVECDVLFGFAWRVGNDTHELSFKTVQIPLADLHNEIQRAEATGLGNFSRDDVWVSFAGLGLKVQFCHHSGIHLSFDEPDQITEHFFSRWEASRFSPIERQKAGDA